ncbi:MAG: efflux RND transporter periplasmic adaptor subunit, partial [Burkholderiales bacterium]
RAVLETGAIGSLRADEAIVIRPEVAGRIERIAFDEGQSVKKGALLATLDAAETRALVASSRAQTGLDKQRLERAADLRKKGFISQQALDEAQSSYARSVAKQREDEAKLAKSEIRAPFPGVAGLRQVSEGAYVAAGTDIARLEKIDQLKLDFRVPETFHAQLKSGLAVSVAVDAFPQASFPGKIYAIEPAVDEQTRTVLARARVLNPELKLRPGMFARVQLTLGVRENAVWIPEEAIVPRGQDSFVFRVIDGKAELVQVQTGTRKVGEVEIIKGLAAGDVVVTEGTQRLAPGMQVSIIPSAKPAAEIPGKKGG